MAAVDLRGRVFLYNVSDMLSNESASPHARWDVLEGAPEIGDLRKYVTRVRVTKNAASIVCCLSTGTIRMYQCSDVDRLVRGESSTVPISAEYPMHRGSVWDAAFIDDRTIVTCGGDSKVRFCNLETGDCTDFLGHTKAVTCLAHTKFFE